MQKANAEIPAKIPAIVSAPIRHASGAGDGRTLSVVSDMPSRSPVSMMINKAGFQRRKRGLSVPFPKKS